jgi:predicted nucleotidyltransferase
MSKKPGIEIAQKLKKILFQRFGDITDRIILFGSRSKGTAQPDSDYDILIVLKTDYDWIMENDILDACYQLDLEYNLLTDIKIISLQELKSLKGKQPFIMTAVAEGISI